MERKNSLDFCTITSAGKKTRVEHAVAVPTVCRAERRHGTCSKRKASCLLGTVCADENGTLELLTRKKKKKQKSIVVILLAGWLAVTYPRIPIDGSNVPVHQP